MSGLVKKDCEKIRIKFKGLPTVTFYDVIYIEENLSFLYVIRKEMGELVPEIFVKWSISQVLIDEEVEEEDLKTGKER